MNRFYIFTQYQITIGKINDNCLNYPWKGFDNCTYYANDLTEKAEKYSIGII